ncbi:MAG TPA: metallophosphoesterase [Halanaerobiaceae bacterium]|jgi:putative phosphoesterase|nr:metallophosphoesterase family protein [Bacillota bacterium]HHU91524.1 metallophosphoesterase [Halanaerobiaceae bacterium]HOA41243.1 metallophosphoesterase family protein [Halanaerobiales bacterium]HPZ63269.1 metallophosphoesterase family protein [Halanaerobiales bacterium]HQD04495.1 metallophosphoesterase family protein [Halanaerobiales bacterium]
MKIGVISDTHIPYRAKQIPDLVLDSFQGVDLIVHAGDLVQEEVLTSLAEIAPVKAVFGNVDSPELKMKLPEKLELELAGYKIGVIHGHNVRGHLLNTLSYVFPDADIIIFGHTHKQCNKIINGQLCFNPGSPTDRRMEKNYSFGIIELADEIKAEIIEF